MPGGLQAVLRRDQEELERERALLRAVLDQIPDPIFLTDREYRVIVANRAALAVIGKPAEEVLGKTSFEYLDDRQAACDSLESDRRVLETGKAVSLEQAIPGLSGPRIFLTIKSPFHDRSGNLSGVIGVYREILDRKAGEAALRENAECLALILEATSGGAWDWNIQTGDAVFSTRCSAMLGYDPNEFARNYETWKDMVHPDDLERVKQRHADHFAGRTDYSIEFRMKEKSGNWHWIHSRGLLIERDSEGKPLRMVGTHSDIQARKLAEEERERLQAQLAHAQKMECVGRLAGGIAHDFGNLMSVILLHSDSALEAPGSNDAVSESVTAIHEAAQKAVALTRQLLAFSHKQDGKTELLDLNSALAGCKKLLEPLIGENIDVVFHHGQGLPPVEVDPGQLYQIVVNLAVNARDAMPYGGRLTIETASFGEADAATIPHAKPGSYVGLTVTDTGVGMDPETQARAFEPFFTTKGVGRGTGLGLSVVYGIVKQNNGHITLQSKPGRGTKFRIYLPAVLQMPAPVVNTPSPPVPRGSETVLLVEDDESLRTTVARVLRRSGYRVLVAADAEQASDIGLQTHLPLQLLLTDIVMPRLSGLELAQDLLELRPGIGVLFMSGYPEPAEDGPVLSRDNLIRKPFTAQQLLSRVRRELDRRPCG